MKVLGNKLSHQMQALDMAKSAQSTRETVEGKSKQTPGTDRGSEKVNLSDRAQTMQKTKEMVSEQMNDVDMDKVARLQKLIDEGQYSVDSGQVADRLINEHLLSAE